MSLTAGAKLQNGKYLIESVLAQTDAGISYQAMHTSLNHPVVIHTLNSSLQQSPRFDWLRQQFLATVKQGGLHAAIVRDCFEENKLPYVVIEPTPTPIKLTDSMPFLNAAVLNTPAPNGNAASVATPAIDPSAATSIAPALQLPTLPTSLESSKAPVPPSPIRPASTSFIPSRRFRWIPIALLFTAATAGLTGGAIGWKLRHSAASPNTPALFSREQQFPEKTDWLGEDPYADRDSTDSTLDADRTLDSASPAVERRTTRRRQAIEPEPEYYEPRSRSRRRIDQSAPEPRSRRERQPQPPVETKPEAEAPKIETIPDPAPQLEALPPAAAPVAPEPPAPAPVEIPSLRQLTPSAGPTSQ